MWCPSSFSRDLKNYLSESVEQSYRMKVARTRQLQLEKQLDSAESAYLPSINLSMELAREKEPSLDSRQYYGPGFALDYDLLSYDRSARVDLNKQNYQNAQKEIGFSHNDILFQLLNTIYDYHLAKEFAAIAKQNMLSLETNMQMVERKVRAGDVSSVNLKRSQARLYAAKAQYVRAEQNVRNTKYRYKALTETELPDDIELPILKPVQIQSADEIKNSVTFQRINQQLKVFEKQIDIARAREYPKISLRVSHNEETGLSATDRDDYDSRAIVALEWPLYTGGRITADIKSSILSKIAQEKERAVFKAALETEFETLQKTIEAEEQALKDFQIASEMAEKVLKGRRFEFNNGGGQNNLVLDAEREFLDFKRGEANSKYTIKKSYLRLLYRTGKLSLESIVKTGEAKP